MEADNSVPKRVIQKKSEAYPSPTLTDVVLRDMALQLVSDLDLESLLERIVLEARSLTGARYAALGVLGEHEEITQFVTSGMSEKERAQLGDLPKGHGILGLLIKEKRPIRLADLTQHGSATGFPLGHAPMTSFLGVPILSRNEVFGNLYLTDKEEVREFTDEDEEAATTLAAVAAIAIDNARLYREAAQRGNEATALLDVSKAVVRSLSLTDVLETIVHAVAALLNADKAHLFTLDQSTNRLKVGASYGYESPLSKLSIPLGMGHVGRTADIGETIISQDMVGVEGPLQHVIETEEVGSCAHVPIQIAGETYGVLTVNYTRANAVPNNALPLLQGMADQAAIAIRNAELYRQAAEERNALGSIFQSTAEGIYAVDRDRRVLRANQRALEMTEQKSLLSGLSCRECFAYLDAEGMSVCDTSCPALEAMQTGEPSPTREVFLPRSDGTRIAVDLSAGPLRDEEGRVIGAVEVVQDVSTRYAAELLREDIVSLVSHELRTPLGHIRGYASSLLQEDVEWDKEIQTEFLEGIVHEATRMARLVSDILELAKMETGGKAGEEKRSVAVSTVMRAGVAAATEFTNQHHIKTSLPRKLPPILVNPSQIEHVISNLVENATKYSPQGSQIVVSAKGGAKEVTVSVADQGPGIPLDQHEKIFDKFVRLPNLGGTPIPGTGLGLSLCKTIVEKHDGKIWVDSIPGQGSRFSFTLPRADISFDQAEKRR